MFRTTLNRYHELRPPIKALVFLYWIYIFTGSLLSIFIQLYLYERFASIVFNMVSTMLLYTGIMIGFVGFGYLASLFRMNIKHGFFWSFFLTALSVILLLLSGSERIAISAMFLSGIGEGLFWLTLHTFELTETKDEERDFYSSILSAGTNLLSLAGPALATLLLWISGSLLHWGNFTLLFVIAPAIYLLGFFCFSRLRDYRPERVTWEDIAHFFTDRKNQLSQPYMMGTGFQHTLQTAILPLAVLFILGTALRVGIYSTILSILTVLCLLIIAHYRTPSNRLKIFGIATALIVMLTLWFGYEFTLLALVIYTIGEALLSPIMRVSAHVIDLQTMESIGRPSADFFATMLLRDFSLWIWRSLAGFLFLFLVSQAATEKEYLVIGLYLLAAALFLTYVGAHILVTKLASSRAVK